MFTSQAGHSHAPIAPSELRPANKRLAAAAIGKRTNQREATGQKAELCGSEQYDRESDGNRDGFSIVLLKSLGEPSGDCAR